MIYNFIITQYNCFNSIIETYPHDMKNNLIFLIMNIKIRNERIWQLEIEKDNLKEIIEIIKEEENK